jgi:hypothetical protein
LVLRDTEGGVPVEADHILGDLLRRTGAAVNLAITEASPAQGKLSTRKPAGLSKGHPGDF